MPAIDIVDHVLPCPDLFGNSTVVRRTVSRDSLKSALISQLKGLSAVQLSALLTNKVTAILEYAEFLEGADVCQLLSLIFNPHRLEVGTKEGRSVVDGMQDDSYLDGLARAFLFKKGVLHRSRQLHNALQMGVNGHKCVDEFMPYVMRDLLIHYKITSSHSVLDPCAGWGGRMIGASAVAGAYHGFDPSRKTVEGLRLLSEFLRSFHPEFRTKLKCLPFEDSDLQNGRYDIAITSPPYYDTEHYACEPTQSFLRYPSFDEWVSGFYVPMIRKTMKALKSGCPFVMNIGSRKYPLSDRLRENFPGFSIVKLKKHLLSGKSGLGKSGEGETFYEIREV